MSKSPYVSRASKRLQEALQEFSEAESERFSLEAEIDLARLLTERAVRLFDEAHYGEHAADVKDELKVASRAALMSNLKNVMECVEKAAKVMALTRGMYTPQQVQQLVVQVTRVIEQHVSDPQVLKDIMLAIEGIKTSNESAKATTNIVIM